MIKQRGDSPYDAPSENVARRELMKANPLVHFYLLLLIDFSLTKDPQYRLPLADTLPGAASQYSLGKLTDLMHDFEESLSRQTGGYYFIPGADSEWKKNRKNNYYAPTVRALIARSSPMVS